MASLNEHKQQFSPRTIAPQDLHQLRMQLQGRALVPGDTDYDNVRAPWDKLNFDPYPALVVLPATTADVLMAVRFARKYHLPIAIQSGGHGHITPANGALLLNFKQMKAIHLNQETATAHVEPGVKFGELIQAAHTLGLAPLNGTSAAVGVAGYMLGGGTGWLARQYGPGAASIRSLEVVTVDGRILRVNASSHPDLFWGLRGGCGNFAIVTSLEVALYPVKEVFGGQVIYPITDGKQVLNAYLEWVKIVPDELTSMVRIMHLPPSPELPEVLRGKSVMIVLACYNGPASTAETVLRPIRTLATPLLDTFASLPYSQIATIANDAVESPPVLLYTASASFQQLLPTDVDAILAATSNPASGLMMFELRHVGGGAYAQLTEETMAFHFSSNFSTIAVAAAPTPELLAVGKQSLTTLAQALQPRRTGDILLNLTDAHAMDTDIVRAAFPPASYQRLVALKNRYDPENMLRFNQNIPPSRRFDFTGVERP